MELSKAIETLFSKMTVSDDMSLDDFSGSFVPIHDELPSITKTRKTNTIKQSDKEDAQETDQSRIKCLEYLLANIPDRPNFFNIHQEANSKFSRQTLEILLSFIKNMTPSSETQKQQYHGKAHLVGLVSVALARLVVTNINLAYDMQIMGSQEDQQNKSKELGSAAKQKQFLSLCRKALAAIVGFATFEQERLSQIRDKKILHDSSTAAGSFMAISELLTSFLRRDIRMQTEQIEPIRSIALKGMLLSADTHTPTMLLCGTIYATLSGFETTEKHANSVKTLTEALQLLIDQCYMLIPEEHDPRKLYLSRVDSSDVTRVETIAKENRVLEMLSLMKRKRVILEAQDKNKKYLSVEEYQLLFKSITHALLRSITIAYSFPIQIDVRKIVDLVRDAAMLDASIYVTNYRPREKAVSVATRESSEEIPAIDNTSVCLLRANSYTDLISTIHLNSLKCLSALVLTCGTTLLPFAKSISIILVQQVKKWCISSDKSSKETCQVFKEVLRAVTVAVDVFGPCVASSLSQPILPIIFEQLSKFHHSCLRVLSTGDPLSTAESQLEDFSFTGKKKKKKKQVVSDENKKPVVSFSNFVETTSIAINMLRRLMSDTRVFISNSVGETTTDVLSTTIDITSVMISSITLWHEQHLQQKIHMYHNMTTPLIIEMIDALVWTLLSTSNVDTQSPFIPHTMDLLRRGVRSNIPEMVSACSKGLLIADSFLHPRSAPIYIPPAESIHLQQLKRMEKEERESRILSYEPTKDVESDEEMEEQPSKRKQREHEKELEQERVTKQAKVAVESKKPVEAPTPVKSTPVTVVETVKKTTIIESPAVPEPIQVIEKVTVLSSADIEKAFEKPIVVVEKSVEQDLMDDEVDIVDEEGDDPLLTSNTDLDSLDLQF